MEEKLELIKDEMSEKIINVAEKIVTMSGTTVTVRKILKELGITNRVFYNRFHNIDEVLKIVYTNTIERVRQSLEKDYDGKSLNAVLSVGIRAEHFVCFIVGSFVEKVGCKTVFCS